MRREAVIKRCEAGDLARGVGIEWRSQESRQRAVECRGCDFGVAVESAVNVARQEVERSGEYT